MKNYASKLLCTFSFFITACTFGFAQAPPQAFSYQAVARDANGNIIANQAVSLRFTIHDATVAGTSVYQETQGATTNSLGLVNLSVGTGTVVSGVFANINWGSGPKYLQVEIDPAGGTNYTTLGTSQMLSVPYALYAGNGGTSSSTGDNVVENYGTGSLTLTAANTTFSIIPGLSDTVNVPANCKVIVRTESAVATTDATRNGYAGAQIAIFVDGVYIGPGGLRNVYTVNGNALGTLFTNYAIEKTFDSAAIGVGTHVFTAQALYLGAYNNGSLIVSSDNSSTFQGVLTVIIVKE